MKLYATTTSERASKGQGGEWLDINLKDDRKVTFAIIKVRKVDHLFMPVIHINSLGLVTYEKTGKPKGYNSNKNTLLCIKRGCGNIQGEGEYCEHHQKELETKGKKKKGDELSDICSNCGDKCHLLADMIGEDGRVVRLCENCLRDSE